MSKKILLVEYETSTIDVIKELLSHPIFSITLANDGETAKHLLAQDKYDMMITAAMLPKFFGFNLSQYAAQNYPGIKIIIISNIYRGLEYKQQAVLVYKANDFFEVPFNKDAFKNKILDLLNMNESELQVDFTQPLAQASVSDTAKIPTLKKLQDKKELTSEDLFGDIIEQVHSSPGYEIKINGDPANASSKETRPVTPPVTHILSKDENAQKESQATQMMDRATRPITPPPTGVPVTQVMEKPQKPAGSPSYSTPSPTPHPPTAPKPPVNGPVTVPITKRVTDSPAKTAPDTTQKIDLEFLDMLKGQGKKEQKVVVTRDKKIEDDISKKFEETLSGLGITSKKPAPKETPKTTPLPPEMVYKKENTDEFGNYEILGLIGRGGMAEIYKAKKKGVKGFEKIIALKKILTGYGEDAKYIEMFVDEAKIAAQLSHPNIVQIHDLGKKDDHYFIAMEYVPGKDLRLILNKLSQKGIHMPEELSIYLIIKVLQALGYAHSASDASGKRLELVHRDVSPPNVLVSYDGNVKLTDFGVSKASTKMHQTLAGALKGKILYMSPEQARGEGNIDYRSDLYSVGNILFELLTGEKLFLGSTDLLTLKRVQEGRIIKPSQVKKNFDPELETILLKALEFNTERRYQKASEMIKDLDSYLVRNFDSSPEPVHMAHFLYTLFKEEIIKEGIQVNIGTSPHPIRRTHREPIKETSTNTSDILELSIDEQILEDKFPEIPSKDTVKMIPPVEMKTEFLKKEEKQEEEFRPIIEINFDDDIIETPPVEPPKKEIISTPFSIDSHIHAELNEDKKKRKFLYILLAVIAVLIVVIVIYLLTAGSGSKSSSPVSTQPGKVDVPGVSNQQTTQTPTVDTAQTTTTPPIATQTPVTTTDTKNQELTDQQKKAAEQKITNQPASETQPTTTPAQTKPENGTTTKEAIKEPEKTKEEPKKIEQPTETLPKEKVEEPPVEQKKQVSEPVVEPTEKKVGVKEGDILSPNEVDSQPTPLNSQSINLTHSIQRLMMTDEQILVSFLVDQNGNVEIVKLIRKSNIPKLNSLIEETIKQWKFKPAIKDNVRVKIWKNQWLKIKK